MPGFVLRRDGKVWLYYSGWNRGVTVPYPPPDSGSLMDSHSATLRNPPNPSQSIQLDGRSL